jgi:lipopolysaccharide heptosyltransferase I
VKVLLVRLSAIGDVVHTLPLLPPLTRAGHRVTWLVEPPARELLEGHPLLDAVIVAPRARGFSWKEAQATRQRLRERAFDVALDLQGLFKSAAWARVAGAPRVIGHEARARKEPLSRWLLRETVAAPSGHAHVIDKNLSALRGLDIEAVGGREFVLPPLPPPLPLPENAAILNPGGGWASKLWPPPSYGALAKALLARGLSPLVTWGPGERPLAERVAAAADGAAAIAPPTTLRQYTSMARRARLVVAADTGPLHLACAVGAPVVALFGPTDPARNGPFSAADVIVRRVPACAPCYRRGCRVHEGIMATLEVDEVVRAVDTRLARA